MDAEHQLRKGLERAGLAPSASYTTGQVARIIGVSAETVRRLVDAYEPAAREAGADPAGAPPRRPTGLRALRLNTHRRIPHDALLDWLRANAAYLRLYGPGGK